MNKPRENLVTECVKKILKNFYYESIITYDYLESMIGYNKEEIQFSAILGAIKEALIEYSYILKPMVNEGYKVLHPKEIGEYVMGRNLVGALAKLDKGVKILHYTDRTVLDVQERERLEELEKFATKLFTENENQILTVQLKLNYARAKELNKSI